jgi:predicted nuclease of predicted toxin-antitoxin system
VLRLHLDADVDPQAALHLRDRGYDVVAAREVGLRTATDPEQLAYAARVGRVLVTHNVRDFAPLYDQWWHEQRSHPGVLVSRHYKRSEIGALVRLLERVLQLATEEDLANRLRYLSEFDV